MLSTRHGPQLTTFSDQNHATKYPDNKARRMGYLPIVPSPAHPDNGILLHLEDGQELRRASYVNTKNHHTVAIRSLRPYYRNQYRPKRKLTDPSFLTLTTYMSYTPSAPCTPLAPLSAELHRPSLPHAPQPAHRSSKPIPTAPIPRRPAVRPLCQLDNYVSSGAERPTPAVTSRRCNAGEELPLFHSTSTYGTFGTPPPPSTPEQPGISGVALLCLLLLLTIAALAGLGYGTYRVLVCAIDLLKRCWDMVRDGHWPFTRP